jgi:hypothetical protein
MHEQQYQQLGHILTKLRLESFSRVVFLVDKNGQQIAAQGDIADLDTTSLASLAAGNVAATGGMAQLIGEKEFPTLRRPFEPRTRQAARQAGVARPLDALRRA